MRDRAAPEGRDPNAPPRRRRAVRRAGISVGRFGPAGDRTTADVVVDREPPATSRIGSRCPAPDMTRRKGPAKFGGASRGGEPRRPCRRRAGAFMAAPSSCRPRSPGRASRPPARLPTRQNRSDARGDRPAGAAMRDGDVRCARTRDDGMHSVTTARGGYGNPGVQVCGRRRTVRARSASLSLAIACADWRFRLKGRRRPDSSGSRRTG